MAARRPLVAFLKGLCPAARDARRTEGRTEEMMLVTFAKNQTMVAMKGNLESVIWTDVQPVGTANYG